jgi:hypothetical protein
MALMCLFLMSVCVLIQVSEDKSGVKVVSSVIKSQEVVKPQPVAAAVADVNSTVSKGK